MKWLGRSQACHHIVMLYRLYFDNHQNVFF